MIDQILTPEFIVGLLASTIQMATPYLLAAQGETFGQRSGVLNMGLEGIMVIGAFAAFLPVWILGSLELGLLVCIIVGAMLGLYHAFMSVSLRTNQSILGITLSSMIGWSAVAYLLRVITGGTNIQVKMLQPISIPLLSQIPGLGKILFNQNILTYLAIFGTPIYAIILRKTVIGLKIKAIGENPTAADSVGLNVYFWRYVCVAFGSIMTALGGGALILGHIGVFSEYIIAGRGWIAVSLVILGNWSPLGILGAALIFGAVDALQFRIQILFPEIPYTALVMLPYILAMAVLIGTAYWRKKGGRPASLGIPYTRGEK